MGDLSKNFSLSEFLRSAEADKLGITNTPLPDHEANIRNVTAPLCQLIRDKVGVSVSIMSGYRCQSVNEAVGGVPDSAHALGLAADISAAGMTAEVLAMLITSDPDIMAGVDQIILETNRNVVHVGAGGRLRNQVLTQAEGPGTPFQAGIV